MQQVCRAGSERSKAAEGVGSGEQQAQKDVGRQDAGSRSNDGCAVKKVVTPAAKKPVVQHLIEGFSLSERVACQLAGLSRTAYRYQSRTKPDNGRRQRLKALATQYPRYGYLMLHGLLRGEGWVKNRKRTYRLYTEEGLQVRTKKRKKLTRPRQPMEVPTAPNQRWSMDFVSDQLSNGRRFRVLNVVDDYSREMVGQLVSVAISGRQVARFLDQLMEERGKPKKVTCDNGTEFTSKAMFFWSKERASHWALSNLESRRKMPSWKA